jgi:hypothetical protein
MMNTEAFFYPSKLLDRKSGLLLISCFVDSGHKNKLVNSRELHVFSKLVFCCLPSLNEIDVLFLTGTTQLVQGK